jgi:hypothetical protein
LRGRLLGGAVIKSVLAAAFAITAFLFVSANPAAAGLVTHHLNHAIYHHHLRHNFWPYGGVVEAQPVSVLPVLIGPAITHTPACTLSRETKSVPSEDGGEKQITITRCY